jgi:hypothetical protein
MVTTLLLGAAAWLVGDVVLGMFVGRVLRLHSRPVSRP